MMNLVKKCLVISSIILFWWGEGAAIDVCGLIGSGTTWSIEDSPVSVTCDLDVADLVVEAGVEIYIAGNFEVVVSGLLRSLGTQASPVVVKPAEDNSTGWKGFYFEDTIDGSEFRWTRIEGANSSAVHLVRSTPLFDHVTFKDNSATHGGAIRAELLDNDLKIKNSLFLNNFAGTAGGAVYSVGPTGLEEAALVITDSVFRKNNTGITNATRINTFGGAVYVNGNSRILRSTFRDNEVRAYTIFVRGGRYIRGGAIYTSGGRTEISATTFIGNAARAGAHFQTPDTSRNYGGALYLASGELLLSNSLLAKNALIGGRRRDHRGAGLYVASGVATVVNTTMTENSLQAIYRAGGTVEVLNSILFFNNSSGTQITGTVTATYSTIQNGFDGEGNINVNPILNDLYGIVVPSPAIDAGNPSLEYVDIFPPGQGDIRNDLGYTGGVNAIFSALPYPGPDQSVNERTTVTLDGTGSFDLDGGVFTYLWKQISGPTVALSDPAAAAPTFDAPEVSEPTLLSFELVVKDEAGDSAPDIVEVAINHVNRVPIADAGPDQIVDERTTISLNGSGSSDPDGDPIIYFWRQTSGPAAALSDVSTATPSFDAPEVAAPTVLSFELILNDGNVNSAPDIVEVTVNHVNRPPVADAGSDQVVDEKITVSLNGSGSGDPDGDPITYFWRQTSGPDVTLFDASTATPSFDAPEVAAPTLLSFELIVNDGNVNSEPDIVEATVNHVNPLPIADAGQDQVVNEETTIQLDGSGSNDPEGEPITYLWRKISGPDVTLSDITAMKPTFEAPEVSTTVVIFFELKVNDGTSESAPDIVEITVNRVNQPPTAKAGPDQVINERTTVSLDGRGSNDLDGDTLSYEWRQLSGLIVTLSNITAATPNFIAPEVTFATPLLFELVVSDGEADSAPDIVEITVNHVNRLPTAEAGPNRVFDEGTLASLDGGASSDPDGDPITYFWQQTSGPTVVLSDVTAAAPTFEAPEVPERTLFIFELQVHDGQAVSVADQVEISVRSGAVSDVDQSGRVDGLDLGILGLAFGSRPGLPNWNVKADLNEDGIVNQDDLNVLSANFGKKR